MPLVSVHTRTLRISYESRSSPPVPQTLARLTVSEDPATSEAPAISVLLPPGLVRLPSLTGSSPSLSATENRLRLDPDNATFHAEKGITLYDQGDFIGAETVFIEMSRLDPRIAPLALNNAGVSLHAQEQFELAEVLLREAVVATYDTPQDNGLSHTARSAYENYSELLEQQGDWEEAVALYKEAIDRDVEDISNTQMWYSRLRAPMLSLARERAAAQRYDVAKDTYREMISLFPEQSYYLADELGTILFNQGKLLEAEVVYREAMTAQPEREYYLHRGLVVTLNAQGREQEAEAVAAKARSATGQEYFSMLPDVRLSPLPDFSILPPLPSLLGSIKASHLDVYNALAQEQLEHGRYYTAEFALRQALTVDETEPDSLFNLGLSLLYQGLPDNAYSVLLRSATANDGSAVRCYVVPPEVESDSWQPADYLKIGLDCLQ